MSLHTLETTQHEPHQESENSSRIHSLLPNSLVPIKVTIEFHSRFQIPSFQIIGLPGQEIQESKERICSAFAASGIEFPKKRVVINLTPSHLKKSGRGLDLPIALSILFQKFKLAYSTSMKTDSHFYGWGELGLDGAIKPAGQLAKWIDYFLETSSLSKETPSYFIINSLDAEEWGNLNGWRKHHHLLTPDHVQLIIVNHLFELIEANSNHKNCEAKNTTGFKLQDKSSLNFTKPHSLLSLPKHLERALLIAVSGGHHLLLVGPKGAGKSRALDWLKALAPEPNPNLTWERLRVCHTKIETALEQRPIRRVHAQVRPSHLLGTVIQGQYEPGELALSHGGFLIADEFLEWPRDSKESLREPFEEGGYPFNRTLLKTHIPSQFQFVGTANFCPCGGIPPEFASTNTSTNQGSCTCHPSEVKKYWGKLSGPIIDRIDLTCMIREPSVLFKNNCSVEENAERLREKIVRAQSFAKEHFEALPAHLSPQWLEDHLPRSSFSMALLGSFNSIRSRHKLLRIARTLQALEGSQQLEDHHLSEASLYRAM